MSKTIYEEAVETLNKYRNQNYNSTNKDEVELANAINVILPNYVKQEKLLRLYREKDNYTMLDAPLSDVELYKYENIVQQIKMLENEIKKG